MTTHTSPPPSRAFIRVNLRFGQGTDPALWRALEALAPYARAKLVRQLMQTGWRLRQSADAQGPARAEGPIESIATAGASREAKLSDDILSLLGGAVRL